MVTTKLNWSGPNVIHFGRKSQFGPDQFILVVTISFWLTPNHYGRVQINLVRPKPFWSDQNCFGHIEGQGINLLNPYLITVLLSKPFNKLPVLNCKHDHMFHKQIVYCHRVHCWYEFANRFCEKNFSHKLYKHKVFPFCGPVSHDL